MSNKSAWFGDYQLCHDALALYKVGEAPGRPLDPIVRDRLLEGLAWRDDPTFDVAPPA